VVQGPDVPLELLCRLSLRGASIGGAARRAPRGGASPRVAEVPGPGQDR
jgi:hypothetical protein